MKAPPQTLPAIFGIHLLVLLGFGFCQEESEAKVDEEFRELLSNSPFTRSINPGDTLNLTGAAQIGGESLITLVDRESKKTYVVSGDANSEGWKLVDITPGGDLGAMTAQISIGGGEMVTVRFDKAQLNPKAKAPAGGVNIPTGKDTRPAPTQEERRKFGEWVRGRMGKMSEEQRKRVGAIMKEKMKNNQGLSDRQKGQVFIQILDHVEKGGK